MRGSHRLAALRGRDRRTEIRTVSDPIDHLYDGIHHVEIPVQRHDVAATHGAGCTHSATLTACLARGAGLEEAARAAARAASEAVRHGLVELGDGEGPVDVLNIKGGE